jgi:hypothetical protein
MPEQFEVSVSGLELHDSILLKDLPMPSKGELVDDPEKSICAVVAKKEEAPEAAVEGEGEEPEVFGEKPSDEDTPE